MGRSQFVDLLIRHNLYHSCPLRFKCSISKSITNPRNSSKNPTLLPDSTTHCVKTRVWSLSNPHNIFYRSIHANLEQTQFVNDASNQNLEAKTDKIIEDCERICKLLSKSSGSNVERLLNESSVEAVTPSLVLEVLKRLSNAGFIAFSFFKWAEKLKGFKHSTESYNALIESLGKIRQFKLVWELVGEMKQKGLLSKETFMLISRRYARTRRLKEAIQAFERIEEFGFKLESSDFNRLIDTLSKSRQVMRAQEVFDKMKNGRFIPNIKSYTILLEGWGQEKNMSKLDEVYQEMKDEGFEPDIVTYGIMINAYCKAGQYENAIELFHEMERKNCKPSPHIFCTLINGLGSVGRLSEALEFFEQSKGNGCAPEAPTYNAVVGAYCWSMKFSDAWRTIDEMRKSGVGPNSRTYDIVLHHLIKAQRMKEAFSIFQKLSCENGCEPTVSTYEIIVRMFCNEGQVDMAMKVWDHMKANGIVPGMHMFSTLITSLCHEDDLDNASKYFQEMMDVGIRPPANLFSTLKQSLIDGGKKDTLLLLARKVHDLRKTKLNIETG